MVKAKRNVQVTVSTGGAARASGGRRVPASRISRRRRRAMRRRGAVAVVLPSSNTNRRRNRNGSAVTRRIRSVVQRTLHRSGVMGPKPAISQSATATLGTVGANQGQDVELEGAFMLNPALTKETTGSNQFGPVQIAAATYNMWKLKRANVRLTPLVGASAVSGTAVRVSLNLSGAPSSSSWSALGARKHVDTSPGKFVQFTITERELPGPKEGWFMTSTKGTPEMAIGGTIEIHTLGKTLSTYTNSDYKGDLFLVEMHATWQFANYSPNPGMLNLVKGTAQEDAGDVKINATPGQPITITTPASSEVTRASGGRMVNTERAGGVPTIGEVVWQIVDTTVDQITSAFPPPFNWLFKGGWWFMKRVTGLEAARDAAGEATFYVYQSVADARNNIPCIATGSASNVTLKAATWEYAQVTPGNSGMVEDGTAKILDTGMGVIDPIPTIDPNLPISYCGSVVDMHAENQTRKLDYGVTSLLFRQQGTGTSYSDKHTSPDHGPYILVERYTNKYALVPNNVCRFDAKLEDPYKTQMETFIQSNLGHWITTDDPHQFVSTAGKVWAANNQELGEIVLGSTMHRQDGALYITTIVFKCTNKHTIKWGTDGARNWGIIKRAPYETNGAILAPLMIRGYYSDSNFNTNMTFEVGTYYGFIYFGSTTDPYWAVADGIALPMSLVGIPKDQDVVLAYNYKTSPGVPNTVGAIQFTAIGMQSGFNLPFKFLSNPQLGTNAFHGTIPTGLEEQIEELQRRVDQLARDGQEQKPTDASIGFRVVDPEIAPSASQVMLCEAAAGTSGSEGNGLAVQGDVSEGVVDDLDLDEEQWPPLTCECKWGGHPNCPYPNDDEIWSDPPQQLCEVDGKQQGLVNILIQGGMAARAARRAIACSIEEHPARIFQNLFESHLHCGLGTNTARSLAFCHALRAKEGKDPYDTSEASSDDETGEPVSADSKP